VGDFNDLTLMGTLSGVEMGLQEFGVRIAANGVTAAQQVLMQAAAPRDESRRAA